MVNLNYTDIGNRIKSKRKELHLTQKELGQKVGLSESSVSKYESGKVEEATTAKLNEFALALGVDISWLLGISENTNDYSIPEQFDKPNDARTYIKRHYRIFASEGFDVDKLDDEKVLEFANALLEQMKLVAYKYKK